MITFQFPNRVRPGFKPLARAIGLAFGLAIGGAQALTTSQTFNLGTSPASTNFPNTGTSSLFVWIEKGSLPVGSILRSITATDLQLEAQRDNSWASNLGVFLDPSPETPGGPGGLLKIGEDNSYGGAQNEMGWGGGNNNGPATVTRTEADWTGPIDLNTVAVMFGNGFAANTAYSGTVTIVYDVPQVAAFKTFGPNAVISPLVNNTGTISWTVPSAADVTALSPTFTLSSGTADRDNGGPATYDFTNPVVYTITDGAVVNTYTVTVTKATAVAWDLATGGTWDLTTDNWRGVVSGAQTVFANGNEVLFDNPAGGVIAINPDMAPLSTTVNAASGTYTFSDGPLAGTGSLVKSGNGTLKITPANHTYSGGTIINGGRLLMEFVNTNTGLGTGPVTLNDGVFHLDRFTCTNSLIVNGGSLILDNGFGSSIPGSITNNAPAFNITAWYVNHPISGSISGPGGITMNSVAGGSLTLSGTNTYTGPTSVASGTLQIQSPTALGTGDLSISSGGAKLNLNYTGSRSVASVTLGGVAQTATGTYGSPASDAIFKSGFFAGTGTVQTGDPEAAAYITSFGTNLAGSAAVIGAVSANAATITYYVPSGTNLATLAPTFLLTPGATSSNRVSGVTPTPGFDAGPVTYNVVSQNTSVTNIYTVSVTVLPTESTLIWNLATGGDWNRSTPNWRGETFGLPMPFSNGLNVVFNEPTGGTILLDGDLAPLSTTVSAISGNYIFGVSADGGAITSGSLIKEGAGTLRMAKANSYDGGTILRSGTLHLSWPGDGVSHTTLGSGPVTLEGGTLYLFRVNLANPLTVNGGTILAENGFGNNWSGPVTLNVDTTINGIFGLTFGNTISGPGGLIKTSNGTLTLSGTNTYSGPTNVMAGTMRFDSPGSVAAGALSISSGAKANLNYSGTRNIASLTLGGELKTAPGTYGSVASGALFQDDNFFTAAGTGTVTLGGTSGSDYDTWLGGFTFADGADTTPTGDPDGDGMSNQQEYAFGLNPTLGSSSNPIVQLLDPTTGNFQYTRRATPATTGFTYTVFTSTDLAGWQPGGATETGFTTAGNVETVTVNVTAPPANGRLFVQVRAVRAP